MCEKLEWEDCWGTSADPLRVLFRVDVLHCFCAMIRGEVKSWIVRCKRECGLQNFELKLFVWTTWIEIGRLRSGRLLYTVIEVVGSHRMVQWIFDRRKRWLQSTSVKAFVLVQYKKDLGTISKGEGAPDVGPRDFVPAGSEKMRIRAVHGMHCTDRWRR